MLCPRRSEIGGSAHSSVFLIPDTDLWLKRSAGRVCSFCGSLHPDDFMGMVHDGVELGPTDKSYKVYLPSGKFYFQHLAEEQRREFVDLYNDRGRRQYSDDLTFTVIQDGGSPMAVGFPGYFYQLPFFMGPAQ